MLKINGFGTDALDLERFSQAGLVMTVWSSVLGERVIFASDNAELEHAELEHAELEKTALGKPEPGTGEGAVVYRAAELRRIWELRGDDLRKIHEVKRVFGGLIVAEQGLPSTLPQSAVA